MKYLDYRRWNTQCCEQVFSYFSNFPSLFHHSNETRAPIWAALLFHFKNKKTEEVLRNTPRVSVKKLNVMTESFQDDLNYMLSNLRN